MPIRVKLPDGSIAQFPDGWSKEQITAELSSSNAPVAAPSSVEAVETIAPVSTPVGLSGMQRLGAAIGVPPSLTGGPSPIQPATHTAPMQVAADIPQGLTFGQKIQAMSPAFMAGVRQAQGIRGGMSPEGVYEAGRLGKAVVGDVAAGMAADPSVSGNIPAFIQRKHEFPMDVAMQQAAEEEKERGEFPWRSAMGETGGALGEMLPKMMMLRGVGGGLGAQSLAAGGIFGIGEGGEFHVKDAAIASLFPGVGAASRAVMGKAMAAWISSGGVKSPGPMVEKGIELLAENAGQTALQLAFQSKDLIKLYNTDKDGFRKEVAKMTAMQLAFMIYGGKSLGDKKVDSFTKKFVTQTAERKANELSEAKLEAYRRAADTLAGGDREGRADIMVRQGIAPNREAAFEVIDAEFQQKLPERSERIAQHKANGATTAEAEFLADRQEQDFMAAAIHRGVQNAQRMAPPPPVPQAQVPPSMAAPAPAPAAPVVPPPVVAPPVAAAPPVVAPPVAPAPAKPAQTRMNPVDAHNFSNWARGKTVAELRQLRDDHENDPMPGSDHAIEIINEVIKEKSPSLTAAVSGRPAPAPAPAMPEARRNFLTQLSRGLDMVDSYEEFTQLREQFKDDPEALNLINEAERNALSAVQPPTATATAPSAPAPAPTAAVPPRVATPPAPIPKSGLPPGVKSRDVYKRATEKKITREAAIAELLAEHQASAQAAISKLGDDVELREIPTGSDDPFARGGLGEPMATVDPDTGKVIVNPRALAEELSTIPKSEHDAFVKSVVNEERTHFRVLSEFGRDAGAAERFADNLSGVERSIARKMLFRKFGADVSNFELGHEMIRFRMQRLAKMTPKEVIGVSRAERWTVESLDLLSKGIASAREFFRSQGARDNLAILDRIELNIAAARSAAGPAPMARRRNIEKAAAEQTKSLFAYGAKQQTLGGEVAKTQTEIEQQRRLDAANPQIPGRQDELFDRGVRQLQVAQGVIARQRASVDELQGQLADRIQETSPGTSRKDAWNLAGETMRLHGQVMANERGIEESTAKWQRPLGARESLADQMDLQEFTRGRTGEYTSEWNVDDTFSNRASADARRLELTEEGNNARTSINPEYSQMVLDLTKGGMSKGEAQTKAMQKFGDQLYLVETEKKLPPVVPRKDQVAKDNERIAKLANDLPLRLEEGPMPDAEAKQWISTIFKDKGEPFIRKDEDGEVTVGYVAKFGKGTEIVRGRGDGVDDAMRNMAEFTKYLASKSEDKRVSHKVWTAMRTRAAEKAEMESRQGQLVNVPRTLPPGEQSLFARRRRQDEDLLGQRGKVVKLRPDQEEQIYNPDYEEGTARISSRAIADAERAEGTEPIRNQEYYDKLDEEMNSYYEGMKDWNELSAPAQDMIERLSFMEHNQAEPEPEAPPRTPDEAIDGYRRGELDWNELSAVEQDAVDRFYQNRHKGSRGQDLLFARRRRSDEGSEQTRMFFGDLLWSAGPKPEDIQGKPGAFEAGAIKPAINKQELSDLAKDKIIELATGIHKGESRATKEKVKTILGSRLIRQQKFDRRGGAVFKAFVKDMTENKGLKIGEAQELWDNNLWPALMRASGEDVATLRSRYNLGRRFGLTGEIADPLPEWIEAVGQQMTLDELAGAKTKGEVSKVLERAIKRGSGESSRTKTEAEKLMKQKQRWMNEPDNEQKKFMVDSINRRLSDLAKKVEAEPQGEQIALRMGEEGEPTGKRGLIEVPRETTKRAEPARPKRDYTGMEVGQPKWKQVMDRMKFLEDEMLGKKHYDPAVEREYKELERFALKALDYTPASSKPHPEFTAKQRFRLRVLTDLFMEMRAESQPGSQESLARKSVTPDDLSGKGPDMIEQPAFRKLNPNRSNSPEWRQSLVDDARHHGRPEEETKRLLVVEDLSDGSIHMLSIYESGHRGIMVAAPGGSKDISLGNLLTAKAFTGGDIQARYRPRYSVLLDEPVKSFRQKFDTIGRFRGEFGNQAQTNAEREWYSGGDPETMAAMHGERGYRRGSQVAKVPELHELMDPMHGPIEMPDPSTETPRDMISHRWRKKLGPGTMEKGGVLQAPEARAVVVEIGDVAGMDPNIADVMEGIRSLGLSAKKPGIAELNWQAISGLQKMMEREMTRATRNEEPISEEEALYNVGFRIMRILKNPHLSEENLMRSYGPRPEPTTRGKITGPPLDLPSRTEPASVAPEILTKGELQAIDEARGRAGLAPASRRVESGLQHRPEPYKAEPTVMTTLPDADRPWYLQRPPGALRPEEMAEIYKEVEAELGAEAAATARAKDEPTKVSAKQRREDERYRKLTQQRTSEPEMLYARRRTEFARRVNDAAHYWIKDPVNSVLGWYSGWLTDNIRSNGGVNAGRLSDLADEQISNSKKYYGSITPVIDVARKATGRYGRATSWMNDVTAVPGAEYAGIRNYVEGAEGRMKIPEFAKATMAVMDTANRKVAELLQPVTGTPPSGKVQRNMTGSMYDIIRAGPGSAKEPNLPWHQLAESNALVNGLTKNQVAHMFNEWKTKLDMVHLSADGIDQVNQDFQRRLPRVVTHLKNRNGTGWEQMVHSKPFNYIETAAQRAAHVRAFREIFPNTPEGSKKLHGLIDLAKGELNQTRQADITALLRTMQGHPSDTHDTPEFATPGKMIGDASRRLNEVVGGTLAKMALTGQSWVQAAETIAGPGAQFFGYKNMSRALTAMLKDRSLYSEFEKEGAVNRVMYDFSYDPSSPIRSWSRQLQNGISKVFVENAMNEFQEALAASAAHVVSERIRTGRLSNFEKRQLPMTFKAMQFTPDQVKSLMAGDPEALGMFKRRAATWLTAGNKAVAESSRLGSNRMVNSLFRFMSYPMMKTNQLRKVYGNFAEAMESGTRSEKLAATEQAARFLAFNTAQGALLSAVTAIMTGGYAGLVQKQKDVEEAPGDFLLESFGATIGGPLWMMMRGVREGGAIMGPAEQAARIFFPYSVGRELQDWASDTGRYQNMSTFEKAGTFVAARTPATKAINMAMAATGLSDEDLELTAALKAARKWRRDVKQEGIFAKTGGDEDGRKFRIHMRRANEDLKVNDLDGALSNILDAAGAKLDQGEQGVEAAKSSLDSRKALRGLKPQEVDDLKVRIGERAVEKLLMHDALIDAVIKGL